IDAALIQMNDVKVVLANTAQTDNYTTLRNNEVFSRVDKTITRNISEVKNSEHKNSALANLFYNALSTHPIFQINVSKSDNNQTIRKPSYRLPWKEKKQTPKQATEEFNMLIDKAITSAKSYSHSNRFNVDDFTNWFNSDYNVAFKMAKEVV
ncbi:hypothetical protein CGK45_24000, partial [Vibrio parahaemolyticus]|uniref:hypothetical protein n=1 Tax=Vibrio parahaemolyticus TaxID=670 RepID=UPI00116B695D